MTAALFFGNSHVASFKTAYDRLGEAAPFSARFFCAAAGDTTFTELRDGRIVPSAETTLTRESFSLFFGERSETHEQLYLEARKPMADVARQFLRTGKAAEIDLEGVSTIFYVAGVSPYDFLRLGETAAPLVTALRAELMERLVGAKYALAPQVRAIRQSRPAIRHAFIGVPLKHHALGQLSDVEREVVAAKRAQVAAMAGRYLFDDVFMPDEDVLEPNLLVTRAEFFRDGRGEAVDFQGARGARADNRHANGDYGRRLIDGFVASNLPP
jgi:hypothetical protein